MINLVTILSVLSETKAQEFVAVTHIASLVFHKCLTKNIVRNTRVSQRSERNETKRGESTWFPVAAQPLFGASATPESVVGCISAASLATSVEGPLELNSRMREKPGRPRPARGILYSTMTRTPLREREACLCVSRLRLATEERKLRPASDGATKKPDRSAELPTGREDEREEENRGAWRGENRLTKRERERRRAKGKKVKERKNAKNQRGGIKERKRKSEVRVKRRKHGGICAARGVGRGAIGK
ncbi:hypothetical protein K0M31_018331 [Melipona bicolor]|uniref:Uncharacterized protein n=1 Tax=Melipona bicolor TaxID=60889 RepID=A0AA40G385_9HYME|nr:hypothetical protein K0M31_018331 [Melipona bicolor]